MSKISKLNYLNKVLYFSINQDQYPKILKKNLKQEFLKEGHKYFQDRFNYVSFISCPDCDSHYLRCPDKYEFRRLVNLKEVTKNDFNYTNICEECSKVFVEKFEDDDPEFEVNTDLYYSKTGVYEQKFFNY